MMHNAIETVGRSTLVIKGKEILCKTIVVGMRGHESASINFPEAEFAKYIDPLIGDLDTGSYPRHKLLFIHFSPFSGMFLDHNSTPGGEKLDEWLEDVRIVDEMNFRYRMVPDVFKEVAGYGDGFVGEGDVD